MTRTNRSISLFWIILHITAASVSEVHITQVDNRMTCSSEGIYPEPELTWSTIPPSSWTLQNRTTVHQTEDQLYSISSSLLVSDGGSDLIYSCTVRTHRNWRRTTLRQLSASISSSRQTTVSCSASSSSIRRRNFMWRFNHSQMIVNQSGADGEHSVSEKWKHHVKDVSASGSLTLQDLSSQHEGVYTCQLSDEDKETFITNTYLRMEEDQGWMKPAVMILWCAATASVFLAVFMRMMKRGPQKRNSEKKNQTPSLGILNRNSLLQSEEPDQSDVSNQDINELILLR